MKKLSLLLIGGIMLSCQQESISPTTDETVNLSSQELLSIEEINEVISKQIEATGDVNWMTDANVLYSAGMHGGGVLTVGYGQKGQSFAAKKSTALLQAKKQIVTTVEALEGIAEEEEVVLSTDAVLNVIDVKITSLATVQALLLEDNIRYIEPNGYNQYKVNKGIAQKSGAGCDKNSQSFESSDFSIISPKAILPWNYKTHNIDKAWQRSTGKGVTVGLIDTGISRNQRKLGSEFNDGISSGKKIERFGTFIDSPWFWTRNTDGPNDRCGHGTFMASAIASPRNDDNLPVGVAYNSNLVAYRAVENVIIDDYHEKKGVSNALKALADRSDVKIISMSLGAVFSIGNVRDAVRYAHSKGKLIFVAGGTSTAVTNFVGVTFPANMNETVAVTGITDNGQYTRCNNCHSGSKIDFTIVMQRARKAGRTVPVLAFNNGESKYIGGSSVATAMTAGIAALVWSKNPGWSREQVLDKLKKSSELYPNRNGQFGYGNIDALKAVQ